MRSHHGGRRVKLVQLHSKSSLFCDSSLVFDLKRQDKSGLRASTV